MLNLAQILDLAEARHCAIPAFNVYNLETAMGVMQAAEHLKAPVIFQMYSRLFDSSLGEYLCPAILKMIDSMSVPALLHLDHGAGEKEVMRALRYGATSVMIDASSKPFAENIAITRGVVERAAYLGVSVEGELGHIGTTKDEAMDVFTDPEEAGEFARQTGVSALAVLVGNAHGRYKQTPHIDIPRLEAIHAATQLPLVLHGGSGIPDEQVRAGIASGIRKVNFGTDLCYAFLDGIFDRARDVVAVDLFMREPTACVQKYAEEKIRLLGAEGAAHV